MTIAMRERLKWLLILLSIAGGWLFLIGAFFCTFPVWFSFLPGVRDDYLAHDARLATLEAEFQTVVHPANTQLLRHLKRLGLLHTGGNGCRYFVGDLRSYAGDPTAVISFYESNNTAFQHEVEIVFLENGRFDHGYMPFEQRLLSGWDVDIADNSKAYVAAIFAAYAEEPGLDLRCN